MRLLAVALLASTCALGASMEGTPKIESKAPAIVRLRVSGAGDSLFYRVSWGAGFGATGYRVSIYPIPFRVDSVAPVGWGTVPTSPALTSKPEIAVILVAPAQWDSARWRVVVWSTRGNAISRDSVFSEWTITRLGGPGPIHVDSSAVIVGFTVQKVSLDDGLALCPVVTFKDGKQGMPSHYDGGPCLDVRNRLLDTLSSRQLAKLDSIAFQVSNDGAPYGIVKVVSGP